VTANIAMVVGIVLIWLAGGLGVLVALGFACRWLLNNPRDDVIGGLLWHPGRIYSYVFHRLRVDGRENIPSREEAGPLVVVSNHTAGVDPVFLQSICPFFVRFVMAEDMRLKALDGLWNWLTIIFVDRVKRSGHGTREAIRHLSQGGVLGIFPEGGLERPARHLMPFEPGIGMLIRRTRARVLPVIIEGTPQVDPAWASLWTPSRSRVRVMPPIDYTDSGLDALEITLDLQRRYVEWTGWPLLLADEVSNAPAEPAEEPPVKKSRTANPRPAA